MIKHYIYIALIAGAGYLAFQAGYDRAENKYLSDIKDAVKVAKKERDETHKVDKAIIEKQLARAEARAHLFESQLSQSEDLINALRKKPICNLSVGSLRMFNDLIWQYKGLAAREPLTDEAAKACSRISGAELERRFKGLLRDHFDLADQLIALQDEVRQRDAR